MSDLAVAHAGKVCLTQHTTMIEDWHNKNEFIGPDMFHIDQIVVIEILS